MLSVYIMLFKTELALRWRRSQEWLYPLGFFLIVVSLFPLAFTPDPQFLMTYIPGCIWIAALLASLLSIDNFFYADMEEGHLEQLLLSPASLAGILFAKLSAQWLVTELPLLLLIPMLACLFHLPLETTLALWLSLTLGTPILILLGALGTTLTLGLRQQGVFLGLLILPLVMPILLLGMLTTEQGLTLTGPLALLSGLLLISLTLFPWLIAISLRISFDD